MSSSPTPRLRVLAGPSLSMLTDISKVVNTGQSHSIESDRFVGRMAVHIKGFPGADESEYFERTDKKNVTWSIQVQGRFLHPYSADDVLFGNTFDRPLRLPWGFGVALKFMHFIDPTLEHDLLGRRPWALSPLIATMPHFAHTTLSSPDARLPPFPPSPPNSIRDDTQSLYPRVSKELDVTPNQNGYRNHTSNERNLERPWQNKSSKRRAYFSHAENRRQITFGPEDVLTTDFCYGFLSFPSLALNLPGGISFDLNKYWDGQPVRFVCVERLRQRREGKEENEENEAEDEAEDEEDKMFWCVILEPAEI